MCVGDYVRIDGYISKIGHIKTSSSGKTYVQWKQPNGILASGNISIIEKSSPNIIDLIEVGDYVNGQEVRYIDKGDGYCYLAIDEDYTYLIAGYDKDGLTMSIKSIVTKEQFSAMEYKIN